LSVREKREQELERQRDKFFNKIQPVIPPRQWKQRTIAESSKAIETSNTKEDKTTLPKGPIGEMPTGHTQ
jgi:ubiquinone biosynthesis protein COQ9